MATSTNYGWSEPDNTSLVKDGAQAIRTLGDAIDTSLWNSGYGQASKNKFINGDLSINQRSFTSTTTSASFTFDRFQMINAGGGDLTVSTQAFSSNAPISTYDFGNFARLVTSGAQDSSSAKIFRQKIENVGTFAGQTVTVSFYAKASTGTPSVAMSSRQLFGTGGSTLVETHVGKTAITASWVRYSFVYAVPSISGKTVGAGSSLEFQLWTSAGSTYNTATNSLGTQNVTIDTWGWQVEYGSKATPFQTASGGSIQGELAMCQRYYYRLTPGAGQALSFGNNYNTIQNRTTTMFPVEMRIAPTALEQNGTANNYAVNQAGIGSTVCSNVPSFGITNTRFATVTGQVASGLTAYNTSTLNADATNGATAYLGWSAEL
jgi:hypothetical protein